MLLSRIDAGWRVAATGVAFLVFFCGGFLLATIAFPLVDAIKPRGQSRRESYNFIVQLSFQIFISVLRLMKVLDLKVDDSSALRQSAGVILIANHPTLIDIVILAALVPRAQCIVKRDLWHHPFLGRVVRGNGYIPNDLDPEAMVSACRAALAEGRSLIIFPEGTRSRPGTPLRFRRGFANLATLLQADIQLALITCKPPTLAKGDKWWAIPSKRPQFHVSQVGWMRAESWRTETYRSITAREIVRRLERFYNERLAV